MMLRFLRGEEQNASLRKLAPPSGIAALGSLGTASSPFAHLAPNVTPAYLTDAEKNETVLALDWAISECERIELDASLNRIKRFKDKIIYITWDDVETEMRVLRETIEDEMRQRFFYAYPRAKAEPLRNLEKQWSKTLEKFPSARDDIVHAVDCYACDHNTASVFHLMRVAECGLRALAREKGVKLPKGRPLEWGTWEAVLVQIDNKVEEIANRRAGPARSRALEFYRGALGEFEAFKEAYRNDVMHARRAYDEGQAFSVLSHVREFMERLSARIDENPKAIRWGLR